MRQIILLAMLACASCVSAQAGNVLEAAGDLARTTNDTDPNAFWLMMTAIGMLFVCALSLIMATSFHVFRRKPESQRKAPERETAGTRS